MQLHLVEEVQDVYRVAGCADPRKHIEIIIRQMLKRIRCILESGEDQPAARRARRAARRSRRRTVASSPRAATPASGRPVLMGITKASLATESWLSAASFQETTRVLTDAAIHAERPLLGLKENVIIGKLIPAGTGIVRHRNVRVEPTEEARSRRTRSLVTTTGTTRFGSGVRLARRSASTSSATTTTAARPNVRLPGVGVGAPTRSTASARTSRTEWPASPGVPHWVSVHLQHGRRRRPGQRVLTEVLIGLFDAIMTTFRWTEARAPAP